MASELSTVPLLSVQSWQIFSELSPEPVAAASLCAAAAAIAAGPSRPSKPKVLSMTNFQFVHSLSSPEKTGAFSSILGLMILLISPAAVLTAVARLPACLSALRDPERGVLRACDALLAALFLAPNKSRTEGETELAGLVAEIRQMVRE